MGATRILIVDDHAAIRAGLRTAFGAHPEWEICGEAENGKEAIEKVRELRPQLVVLDVSMPIINGIEAAREIRRIAPDIKILTLTMHNAPQLEAIARQAGADALVIKSDSVGLLTAAVERLLSTNGRD